MKADSRRTEVVAQKLSLVRVDRNKQKQRLLAPSSLTELKDLAGIHSAAKLDKLTLKLLRLELVDSWKELQGNFLVLAVHKKVVPRRDQQSPFGAAALGLHSAVWDRSVCNSG